MGLIVCLIHKIIERTSKKCTSGRKQVFVNVLLGAEKGEFYFTVCLIGLKKMDDLPQ